MGVETSTPYSSPLLHQLSLPHVRLSIPVDLRGVYHRALLYPAEVSQVIVKTKDDFVNLRGSRHNVRVEECHPWAMWVEYAGAF